MTPASSLSEEATERRSQRRKAELALFSLEADRSRFEREQTELATTVHGLRQSLHHLEIQIQEEEAKLGKVDLKIASIEAEIQRAKKTLRLL